MMGNEHRIAGRRAAESDSVDSLLREAVDISEGSTAAVASFGFLSGDVLSERFVIERFAGSGGMGAIYRGKDRHTDGPVAIKVLASGGARDAQRFAQEALVLAHLSHPSIVRYVAHGATPQGTRFLAMEWLEGEDLAQRLARSSLTVGETVTVLRRSCEGLAVAHARGLVHRDIKPSNLFLVDGDPASTKIIDFGIARHDQDARPLTRSGTVLGTVGYMSPEQAMGPSDVDARADIFALGCVLFECLTGRGAFVGRNAVAVLAKVLREAPTRVSELRPDIGEALDVLVGQMLAKNPDERPKDAAAILRALDELGEPAGGARPTSRPSAGLTAAEQKLVSVILGRQRRDHAQPAEPIESDMNRIGELTRRFGAEPVAMRGGGILVVLSGRGAATDQATEAARCGLLLRRLRPELRIAIATGRAETMQPIPVGAAIDRAAELLAHGDGPSERIAIDDLTAGLLDPSLEVERTGGLFVLSGERADLEAPRLLMGKPTPFVGREKELALLDMTLRECIDESVARAIIVTGPPGQGKSRLRHELVAKARERGTVRILIARADQVGAGSAFLLARQLVRRAVGLREGDPTTEQQARLRVYVDGICKGADTPRIADFLGELIGVHSSERLCPELRAARNDPQIMSVWLRRSFGEWLAAECAAGPLLLILEDLHWGDFPSVTYLSEALRILAAKPLMVLAVARPEIHARFPNLWAGAEKQEIALGRLTTRAAERLVRECLGDQLAVQAVPRIVERADGNAFYLEELIRRVAEGEGESLPETVLALIQSRLERLEPAARRIVRAASIFGEVFWQSGIAAVLGSNACDLGACLGELLDAELLSASRDSRFPAEVEYSFRHGLLREAAYAMLTDADRATGHGLAGDWLEHAGEKDALRLADHFERGGVTTRAIPWLLRAAQTAVDGGNVAEGVSLGHRGILLGAQGMERGCLRLMQAQAQAGNQDWPACLAMSREAMALVVAGSTEWFRSAAFLLLAGSFLGDSGVTALALQEVLKVDVRPEPSGPYGQAIFFAIIGLTLIGQSAVARATLARAEAMGIDLADSDPVFVIWLRCARARLKIVDGDLGGTLASMADARLLADRTGAGLGRAMADFYYIGALSETGHVQSTAKMARELLGFCEPLGLRLLIDWTIYLVAWTRIATDEPAQAIEPLRALLDRGDQFFDTCVRSALMQALLACGDVPEAERMAVALTEETMLPSSLAVSLRGRALIEFRLNRPQNALALAERGLATAMDVSAPLTLSSLRLTRIECLLALGRNEEVRAAIREARDGILHVAATLDDAELRASYLNRVQAHARTLNLATEWLGERGP